MQIIKHTTGKNIGQISVLNTIDTMEVDEIWETSVDEVKLGYVQVCCSRHGATTGKLFWVSAPKDANGKIIIKRTK